MRKNKRIPKFVEERDPTPSKDTVVLLGKMIVRYRVDSNMKKGKQNLELIMGSFEMYW